MRLLQRIAIWKRIEQRGNWWFWSIERTERNIHICLSALDGAINIRYTVWKLIALHHQEKKTGMQVAFIATAIGLGIAYAAAPGAVNTEAIRRGATHGARSTLLVETGSLIGDSLWAILALTGVAALAQYMTLQVVLGIAGGCFLLRMAWLALYEAFTKRHAMPEAAVTGKRGDFATGVVFGLANPVGLAFWSGLGSSVVASGSTGTQFVLFFAGFFIGALTWGVALALVIRWGRRWIRPTFFLWINVLCGLALGYFGIRVLWTTLQGWLEHQLLPSLKPSH
jgi:threonine/homoserine/homoserine lactone efflux protein